MDGWSTFRGHAIEPIVRASIEHMLPDERFGDANFVNAYWTRTNDPEVNLVGHAENRQPKSAAFIGSIKWRDTTPFSHQDGTALAAVRTRVPLTNNATLLVGVSRNGFSGNTRLDIELGPEQLLNAWTTRR